jgi:hypothetical protein
MPPDGWPWSLHIESLTGSSARQYHPRVGGKSAVQQRRGRFDDSGA